MASVWSKLSGSKFDRAAMGPLLLSVLSVVLIVLVFPIVMGGAIALSVNIAGESVFASSPDDSNTGVDYLDPFSDCSSVLNPALPSTSTVAVHGLNWTSLGQATCNTGSGTIGSSPDGPFYVQFPAGVLSSDEQVSLFSVTAISPNYCDAVTTCARHDNWGFDWAVFINGSKVMGEDNIKSKTWLAANASMFNTVVGGHYYTAFEINHSLSSFESLDLSEALTDCGANGTILSAANCNATLRIDNFYLTGSTTSYRCEPFACSNGLRWRFSAAETSADTHGTILRGSTWLLGGVSALMAVAATPAWNPFAGWVGAQVKGGRGAIAPAPSRGRIR